MSNQVMAHTKLIAETTVRAHQARPTPKSLRFCGANFLDGWRLLCVMSKPYLATSFHSRQSVIRQALPNKIGSQRVVVPFAPVAAWPPPGRKLRDHEEQGQFDGHKDMMTHDEVGGVVATLLKGRLIAAIPSGCEPSSPWLFERDRPLAPLLFLRVGLR